MIYSPLLTPELLSFLCHPHTHEPLQWKDGHLIAPQTGETFGVHAGMPRLLPARTPFRHRFWAWVYNRMAFAYDWGVAVAWRLPLGGQPIDRHAYLEKIDLQPGELVLETAVGTGANLQHLPAHARYVGLDISLAMLRRCQKNLARWGRKAALVQGDAQALPFRDGVFEAVYHMGGLQFLTAPHTALAEAWRVTRPGGRIWIVDETYSIPGLVRRSPDRGRLPSGGVEALRGLVPAPAIDIHAELISNGELYFLSFRKRC
jgi:SAM-dependent methyltransferase